MSNVKFYIDFKEGRKKKETKEFTSKQGYEKALVRKDRDWETYYSPMLV